VARGRELISLIRNGAIDGLSIGFRTVKGRIDPKTLVRSLLAVDLWEISIVTFPLLNGARVQAVKEAPRASFARRRAEQDWRAMMGRLDIHSTGEPQWITTRPRLRPNRASARRSGDAC
jgi:phage head maturation protease